MLSDSSAAHDSGTGPRRTLQPACDPAELFIYRDRTAALLRRYCRLSVELGRLPSLLGREFFRARVTSYRIRSFEDAVIFVHDVERCLEKLDALSQQLLARLVLQEFTQEETAKLVGCARRTVVRQFPQALDKLTCIFLEKEILQTMHVPIDSDAPSRKQVARAQRCQAAADEGFAANGSRVGR